MTQWQRGKRPTGPGGSGPTIGGTPRALAAIDDARAQAIPTIFGGTKLEPHVLRSAFYAKDLRTKGKKATNATAKAAKAGVAAATEESREAIRQQLLKVIRELFDVSQLVELAGIVESAVLESTIEIITDAAPYLGLAKNAKGSAVGMVKTGTEIVSRVRVGRSEVFFLPGDALAAVKALEMLINRQIAFNAATTTREFVTLSAKTAGIAASFGADVVGPVAGAANAVAGLVQSLTAAAIEFNDMRAGNRALEGTLDARIFGRCPILACYFLTCASTSDLINFLTGEIPTPGFMDRAEKLRKNIEVSRNRAAQALGTSRYVLTRNGGEIKPMARATATGPKIRTKETGLQGMSPKQYAQMKGKQAAKGTFNLAKTQAERYAHNFSGMVRSGL